MIEVVIAFSQAINRRDLDALVGLMTDDHVFIDTAGGRVEGRESCRAAWEPYPGAG